MTPTPPQPPPPKPPHSLQGGGAPDGLALNIIALDDDADFREYIQSVLSTQGHDVRVVATPAECFAACESMLPDVLLLDIKMGHASGQTVLEELHTRWPKLCIIIVTGYPSLDSMRETFKRDAFDYLAKPFSLDELRGTLAQAALTFGLGQRPEGRLRSLLGRQIRVARTERGWTLKELGESSGVSVSQLSSIERGSHLPSLESLLEIARALGVRPSQWLVAAGF